MSQRLGNFDLALKFDPKRVVALSNMPELMLKTAKRLAFWKFETTPRMSSYLLAFAAGDMQGITAKTRMNLGGSLYDQGTPREQSRVCFGHCGSLY